MKITTRNAKRNPLEEIFAGYFVLKESGMVTEIEVKSVCRGMYYCWGTDPKQSTPMKMDRIYSTGCVPDCTQNHFPPKHMLDENSVDAGEIYTYDAKRTLCACFLTIKKFKWQPNRVDPRHARDGGIVV